LPSPLKDNGLDEVNEAILLSLSDEPFSSVASVRQMGDRPHDMRPKRLDELDIIGLSRF
jgi:hypothetical protein